MSDSKSILKLKKYVESDQYILKIEIWKFLLSFYPIVITIIFVGYILYMYYYDVGIFNFSSSTSIILTGIPPLLFVFMLYKKTNNKAKTKLSLQKDNKQSIYILYKISTLRKKAILHKKERKYCEKNILD